MVKTQSEAERLQRERALEAALRGDFANSSKKIVVKRADAFYDFLRGAK